MKTNSPFNKEHDQPAVAGRIKPQLLIFLIYIFASTYTQAQNGPDGKETYDALQFYMPEGYKPAYDPTTVSLNSNPEICKCSFVLTGTLAGSKDPKANFEDAWNTLIVPALSDESPERKTWNDNRNNWKGFAGSSSNSFGDELHLQMELHTYTRNGRYVNAMFFYEADKCEADRKLFLQYLSLADDAAENGPAAKDYYVISEPEFLPQESLTGVWTIMQDDSTGYFTYIEPENFVTFMDDGNIYNALLPYGSFHQDRSKLQKDDALKNQWGRYTIDGTQGSIVVPSEQDPIPLTIVNDTLISAGEYQFVKSKTVSNYRLEGVWAADFSGINSKLTLNLVNRFTDTGIFHSLHDVNPWLFADEEGGAGKYQIYDHTIFLQYDDGRSRTLSLVNPGYFDLKETNALLLIGTKPFKKLSDETVTY